MKYLLISILLTLGACSSINTQTLDLSLNPQAQGATTAGQVTVRVYDQRPSKELGRYLTFGGRTAPITLREPVQTIKDAVSQALSDSGIHPVDVANKQMIINLQELTYFATNSGLKQKVDIQGKMSVEMITELERFSGNFNAQSRHELVGSPNEAENEQLVSELVNDLINRILASQDVRQFLN